MVEKWKLNITKSVERIADSIESLGSSIEDLNTRVAKETSQESSKYGTSQVQGLNQTSGFVRLLVEPKRVALIDIFYERRDEMLSMEELEQMTGMQAEQIQHQVNVLSEIGLIREVEPCSEPGPPESTISLYQINHGSELTHNFGEVWKELRNKHEKQIPLSIDQ